MAEYVFEIGDALFDEENGTAVFKPKFKEKLIRCADCKYYTNTTFFGRSVGWCERFCDEFDRSAVIAAERDGFCNMAEERGKTRGGEK